MPRKLRPRRCIHDDDALLAGEEAKAKKPDDWVNITGITVIRSLRCMVCKGDLDFAAVYDAVACTSLARSTRSRQMAESPIPPKGLNPELPVDERQGQGAIANS